MGYRKFVSVAVPGENSGQVSFDEKTSISRNYPKVLKSIQRYEIVIWAVHRYARELLELLQHLSLVAPRRRGAAESCPENKHQIHFHNKTRTLLILLL